MSFRISKSLHQLTMAIAAVCCFNCAQSATAQGIMSRIQDEPRALNFEDESEIDSPPIGSAQKHSRPVQRDFHQVNNGIAQATWQYSSHKSLADNASHHAARQSSEIVLQPQFTSTLAPQVHTTLAPQFAPAPVIVSANSQLSAEDYSYVAACGCGRTKCRACRRLLELARPDISNREHPYGGMSPRYPYETERFYYYQRPYNSQHVIQKSESVINGLTQQTASRPYSNGVTEALNKQAEKNLAASGQDLVDDGFLEYVDWRDHQTARVKWEANQPAPSNQNARFSPPSRRLRLSR